jgi:hypothetical protein
VIGVLGNAIRVRTRGSGVATSAIPVEEWRAPVQRSSERGTFMTTKTDYTDEEWASLLRAPIVAGMALSIADPGGPIELTREVMATHRAVTEPATEVELVTSVSGEIGALAERRRNPIGDFKPERRTAGQQVLDEIALVDKILRAKAPPEEADAFRAWLMSIAQQVAEAAKEGGFMGFGAEQVSAGEREMLGRLRTALGVSAG